MIFMTVTPFLTLNMDKNPSCVSIVNTVKPS